jgi:UDP-2,4-diacetamido-2,4,6-trideoxy-beta-L-altropyranose hydrolase
MIAFRVDANESVATGHLMRCLAMAVELRKRGKECIFFLAEKKETKRLEEKKFPYVVLESRWDCLEEEIPVLEKIIRRYSPECLVVDSYQVTENYLEKLESMVPVLYIDDMAEHVWKVFMVLHYTDWMEDASYQERYRGSKTKVLVGMNYVPLREEFYPGRENDPGKKSQKNKRNHVLITTGGTDAYNVAGKLLKHVLEEKKKESEREKFQNIDFHVIVGSMNRYRDELEAMEKRYSNIILHHNVNNMGELMRNSDIAISAGGTTLFELCACQVPSVCFSFADNQKEFAEAMGKHGIMLYAGDARDTRKDFIGNLAKALERLQQDSVLAETLRNNMGRLVDGNGTKRIAGALCHEIGKNAAKQL